MQENHRTRTIGPSTSARRILILGNGGASVSAVRSARAAGHSGSIEVVSDRTGPAFNPMLSPYYLDGKIPFDCCFPFGMEFYDTHHVTCHFGIRAEKIDPLMGEVYLETGQCLKYDECLIATGARPVLPGLPGIKDSRNIYTFRTARDTLRLQESLYSGKRLVILGASLIGIKLAEILIRRGAAVTLVDVADRILPNMAHSRCARFMTAGFQKEGVTFLLGWTLEGVEDNGKGVDLHFEGNRSLQADLCIMGVGVRPNLGFLGTSDIEMDRGIIVDERMRTSADHLFAAGDVCQGMNILSGKKEIIGLWGNACYQGRTAGINMAGGEAVYHGTIPAHVNTLFGSKFVHLGDINRQGKDVIILSRKTGSNDGVYQLFVFDKGVLVGVNLVNSLRHAGRLRTAILRRLDWTGHINRLTGRPGDRELDRILYALRV